MWLGYFFSPSVSAYGFAVFQTPQPPCTGGHWSSGIRPEFSPFCMWAANIFYCWNCRSWSSFSFFLTGRGLGLFQLNLAWGGTYTKQQWPQSTWGWQRPPRWWPCILVYLCRSPSLLTVFEGIILWRMSFHHYPLLPENAVLLTRV